MSDILSIYSESLFWLFPVAASLLSMFVFMGFAGPLTWLAWRDPPALRRYKIQSRKGRAHQKSVVWPSIESWAVNNLSLLMLVTSHPGEYREGP